MTLAAFLFPIGWPLLMALGLILAAARPLVWRLMPLAALPALVLALLTPEPRLVAGDWFVLGLTIGLDQPSRLFLIFTSVLWITAGSAARQWLRGDKRATHFGVFFLMALSGNLGLILSKDAMAFYGAFALMSFASYGLVLHSRDAGAKAAARLYIGFVVIGELILFSGLVLAATQAGSILLADMRATELSGASVALLLVGFGIKLGVMPLHFWLPPAHGAAPVPASAVLSGAMIKAGLFGIISAVPLGLVAYEDHATLVMAAGMITIFAALLMGVQQDNAKPVLGFSSVSQMGIIALGLGAGLMEPRAWAAIAPVLIFLAAHHALAKGALFLGVGAWAVAGGLAGRVALTLALGVPALVLAGLPFASGALGKEALKEALKTGPEIWLPWLTLALTLSGLATTLLMARALALIWLSPPKAPPAAHPAAMALPFLGLAAAAAALPLIWPRLDAAIAAPVLDAARGDLWPLALGVGVALAVAITAHARAIGVERFLDQLAAPFRVAHALMREAAARRWRVARRFGRWLPRRLESDAARLRLGQSAIAGFIAAILIIEAVASRDPGRIATPAVTLQDAPVEEDFDALELDTERRIEDAEPAPDPLAP